MFRGFVEEKVKHGRGSIIVWACNGAFRTGWLTFIDDSSRTNSEVNRNLYIVHRHASIVL